MIMVYFCICFCHLQFLSSVSYNLLNTGLLPPQIYFQIFYSSQCDCKWDSFLDFSSRQFIVSIQKCNRFLHSNFVSYNFTEFIDEFQQFFGGIFRIFYVQYYVICKPDGFASSFTILILLISFSCLIVVAKTSNTMLSKSGKSGHLYLVPDPRGNAFRFSPLSMMLAVGLSYIWPLLC